MKTPSQVSFQIILLKFGVKLSDFAEIQHSVSMRIKVGPRNARTADVGVASSIFLQKAH